MPHLQDEDEYRGSGNPPDGYEGHLSTGLNCLRCGAHIKGGAKFRRIHDQWHEAQGDTGGR